MAEKEERRALNRYSNNEFASASFLGFVKRIDDLWFSGKESGPTGREGIYPAETFDNGELSFVLREKMADVCFSTALMNEAGSLVHRKAHARVWPRKKEADPEHMQERDLPGEGEYQPSKEELRAVKEKLAQMPAWHLDKHQYREKSLLDLAEWKNGKSKKMPLPSMETLSR